MHTDVDRHSDEAPQHSLRGFVRRMVSVLEGLPDVLYGVDGPRVT